MIRMYVVIIKYTKPIIVSCVIHRYTGKHNTGVVRKDVLRVLPRLWVRQDPAGAGCHTSGLSSGKVLVKSHKISNFY